jgi:hypothetical protein
MVPESEHPIDFGFWILDFGLMPRSFIEARAASTKAFVKPQLNPARTWPGQSAKSKI